MAHVLSVSAYYYEDGDFVEVQAYVSDNAADTYVIKEVVSGICKLIHIENVELARVTFDYFNGNSDGGFKFMFLHPAHIRHLEVDTSVTLKSGGTLKVQVPVHPVEGKYGQTLPANVGGLEDDGFTKGQP